ncbi:hypothetical protein [Rickettsia endosymbiont of Nabis limbatus]|uniref:hypothetical protein n=1 Tax=Rickettsia endosymbiont of Nabis limbatus TaxID=3066268 RepID=UPI003AF35BF4
MESFKNKDSLVKNKKKYLKEGIKEKLLEPIYFKDPALNSVKPSKENQANPFPNNKNQTDLFQPDFTKLDQNFPYNMHIKRQQKFLKDMQLRLPKSRFKSKKDGKYYPHQIYPYPEIKELY